MHEIFAENRYDFRARLMHTVFTSSFILQYMYARLFLGIAYFIKKNNFSVQNIRKMSTFA